MPGDLRAFCVWFVAFLARVLLLRQEGTWEVLRPSFASQVRANASAGLLSECLGYLKFYSQGREYLSE